MKKFKFWKNGTIIILFEIFVLIFIDLFTKYIFFDKWFLSKYFLFQHVFNLWVSWWIEIPKIIIFILWFLWVILFIYLFKKKYINGFVFILLISWTLWNIIDRFFYWWVRDFIQLFNWFPVFNLADVFLNIWVIYFIYNFLIDWKK